MSNLSDYDYDLPSDLIAQHPLARRTDARLMVVDRRSHSIERHHVRDLPTLLQAGDCLTLNDTRVVPARLIGFREKTGGRWEGLFLATDQQGVWRILAKTRGKAQPGETVHLVDTEGRRRLQLRLLAKEPTGAWLALPQADPSFPKMSFELPQGMGASVGKGATDSASTTAPVGTSNAGGGGMNPAFAILESIGHVPLPHYIRNGQMTESDRERYQTVYARESGSAAAPTAGLHFSAELLERLVAGGVANERVTLHVGLDTFRPIGVENLADHQMHSEWARLTAETAERLRAVRAADRRVIAVGTTSARVLETAARSGRIEPFEGQTDLFIRPPYEFHAVDALLTNFHLPRSTLLVLVRTFGGDALMRRAYEVAIEEEYRFYSYGDAMLIL